MAEEISFCRSQVGADPDVRGWRLFIKAPAMENQTKGGILLPDTVLSEQKHRKNIGQVLKIGSLAFSERFESLKCNVGDWIAYSIIEREIATANGHVCYYINDDKLIAVIPPEDVSAFLQHLK